MNILEVRNVSKTFPGVKALQNIDFDVKKGSVHALMGENGAGKSTLVKTLYGIYSPDPGGSMRLDGAAYAPRNSLDALRKGVAMKVECDAHDFMQTCIWVANFSKTGYSSTKSECRNTRGP